MVLNLRIIFISTLFLSTSLYAVGPEEDEINSKPGLSIKTPIQEEADREPDETQGCSFHSELTPAVQDSDGGWLPSFASFQNAVATAYQGLQNMIQSSRELDRNIRKGIDLYRLAKTTSESLMESSESIDVPPIAANFLKGFYEPFGKVVENLLVNTIHLYGPEQAARLADDLGISQRLINGSIKNAVSVNPLDNIYINIISAFFHGLDITALAGKATQGILPVLQEKAQDIINEKLETTGSNGESVSTIFMTTLLREGARSILSDFTTNTIQQTHESLFNDMINFVPETLRPLFNTLLKGADKKTKEQGQMLSKASENLSPIKNAFDTAQAFLEPKTWVKRFVPYQIQEAWNHSLLPVNRSVGSLAGGVAGVFAEDNIKKLGLAQMELFSDEQLRISLPEQLLGSSSQLKGFEKILSPMFSTIFQEAGRQAGQKVLKLLEDQLSKKTAKHDISYDIRALMYSQVQPSYLVKASAAVVRGIAWGYQGISQLISLGTDPIFWEDYTSTIFPQFADDLKDN